MADEFSDGLDDLPSDTPVSQPKVKPKVAPKPPVAVEPDPEPEPTPAPKKHEHTQRLVNIARSMGFTQADLDNHDSARIWEEVHHIQTEQRRQVQPETKKVEPEPEEDYDLGPDAEGFDETSKKLLKKIALSARKEVKDYKAKTDEKLAALEAQHTQRRDADINTMLDDAFDALPKKFKKILGDGAGTPEFLKTPEGKRRIRVYQEAGIDPGKVTPRIAKQAILAAAETLFGFVEGPAEVEEDEPEPKPKKKAQSQDPETGRFTTEQFNNAKIAKGSGRLTGIEQLGVVEGVRQLLRNNGHMVSASVEGDMDDLPG